MRRTGGLVVASVVAAVAVCAKPQAARADVANECMVAAEQSQPLRRDGKLIAARRKLLECERTACPAFVRDDCTKWRSEVDAAMPSVIVRAVDASNAEVSDVRVSVDGQVAAPRLDGQEIPVHRGIHVVRYERAGSPPVEDHVLIREGEQGRVLFVKLEGPPPAPPPTPTAVPPPAVAPRPVLRVLAPQPETPPPAHAGAPVLPLILIGVGVAGLGVASYFWVSGLEDRAQMESTCAPSHSCSAAAVSGAQGNLQVGDVAGGAGILAAAVGTLLYLTRGHGPAKGAPPVELRVVAGGAVIDLGGRF